MYNYFVYVIRRPKDSGDVRRYIGVSHFSGRNSPNKRFANHKKTDSYIGAFIRKYPDSKLYMLVQDLTHDEAYELEKELVPSDDKRRKELHLINECEGGQHPPKFSDLNPETQEKVRKRRSEIQKEKYSDEEFKEYLRQKKIKPYSLLSPDGVVYIGVGICDFCKRMNLEYTCIGRVMNNQRLQYKGWKKYYSSGL